MPTGYTAYLLEDGADTSLKTFTMKCARAFGACISMKEDSLDVAVPEEFVADSYHLDKVNEAKCKLDELGRMLDADIEEDINRIYNGQVAEFKKRTSDVERMSKSLNGLRDEIIKWNPPSEDHVNLKKFMREQIDSTIDCDCKVYMSAPEKMTIAGYRKLYSDIYARDIKYHEEEYEKECERVKSGNKWISDLRLSLATMEN